MSSKRGPEDVGSALAVFYSRFFPFDTMYKWLSLHGSRPFPHREFSMTFGEDIYLRYQSFANSAEFRSAVCERTPSKIDIGAEFSFPPKDHNAIGRGEFVAKEKEMVFDIDMTDYDDIRTCCKGADVCKKCWKFMSVSGQVLRHHLNEAFGFQDLLFVFSGRRGIHCWVSDPAARVLSVDGRSAVADFIHAREKPTLGSGHSRRIHPNLAPLLRSVLAPAMETLVESQDWLSSPERWRKFLDRIEDKNVASQLHDEWAASPGQSSLDRWHELMQRISPVAVAEMTIWFVYPRLDVHVSKGLNHLLKSPFCVHPKSGKVCVPIDPDRLDEFDPTAAPTLELVLQQLDRYDSQHPDSAHELRDCEKTSMKDPILLFEQFVTAMGQRLLREKRAADLSF